MLVKHYCDGKSYDVPQAAQHPHMTGLLPCSMGWSKTVIVTGTVRQIGNEEYFLRDESTFEAGPQIQAEVNREIDEYARLAAEIGITPPLAGEQILGSQHKLADTDKASGKNREKVMPPGGWIRSSFESHDDSPNQETTAKPQEGSNTPTLTQEEAKRVIVCLQSVRDGLMRRFAYNSARKVQSAIDFVGGVQRLLPTEKDERVEVVDTINVKTGQVVSREIGGRKYAMNPVLDAPYNMDGDPLKRRKS